MRGTEKEKTKCIQIHSFNNPVSSDLQYKHHRGSEPTNSPSPYSEVETNTFLTLIHRIDDAQMWKI